MSVDATQVLAQHDDRELSRQLFVRKGQTEGRTSATVSGQRHTGCTQLVAGRPLTLLECSTAKPPCLHFARYEETCPVTPYVGGASASALLQGLESKPSQQSD